MRPLRMLIRTKRVAEERQSPPITVPSRLDRHDGHGRLWKTRPLQITGSAVTLTLIFKKRSLHAKQKKSHRTHGDVNESIQ